MSKTIDTIWFTTMDGDLIGINMNVDEITKERKLYIGVGDGLDEHLDISDINSDGAKISKDVVERLLSFLGENK